MEKKRLCTKEDLRIAGEATFTCAPTKDGSVVNWISDAPAVNEFVHYYCANCLHDFVPEDNSVIGYEQARQAAIDHVKEAV